MPPHRVSFLCAVLVRKRDQRGVEIGVFWSETGSGFGIPKIFLSLTVPPGYLRQATFSFLPFKMSVLWCPKYFNSFLTISAVSQKDHLRAMTLKDSGCLVVPRVHRHSKESLGILVSTDDTCYLQTR